ncbi:hypothetical protein EJB05_21259, partial [Eragrostis curvula]
MFQWRAFTQVLPHHHRQAAAGVQRHQAWRAAPVRLRGVDDDERMIGPSRGCRVVREPSRAETCVYGSWSLLLGCLHTVHASTIRAGPHCGRLRTVRTKFVSRERGREWQEREGEVKGRGEEDRRNRDPRARGSEQLPRRPELPSSCTAPSSAPPLTTTRSPTRATPTRCSASPRAPAAPTWPPAPRPWPAAARTHDYVVAAKGLALAHRLVAEGDPHFRLEVIRLAPSGRLAGEPLLALLDDFRDEAHSASWDHSAFVRAYAGYLDARVRYAPKVTIPLRRRSPNGYLIVNCKLRVLQGEASLADEETSTSEEEDGTLPGSNTVENRKLEQENRKMEQDRTQSVEKSTKHIFSTKGKGESEVGKISDISGKIQQTNERQCSGGTKSAEFHYYDDDYTLTEEDEEALQFIIHSYKWAGVVDLPNHPLIRVDKLKAHAEGGWISGVAIDAYASLCDIEGKHTTVLTTFQSALLLGTNGVFNARKKKWTAELGKRCAIHDLVFVPFNAHNCHWTLLVLNFRRKEIEILDSLASSPNLRDKTQETTLVKSIQQCIDYAVEKGLLSLVEPLNLNSWNKHMKTDIPQQGDCSSCGVYVIRYMQLWNGVFMRETFTQKEECKSDKEKDDEGQGIDSDDVIEIVSWGDETTQGIKGTLSGKKRGRQKKSGHNTKAAPPEASPKSQKTVAQCVQGTHRRRQLKWTHSSGQQLNEHQTEARQGRTHKKPEAALKLTMEELGQWRENDGGRDFD